MSRMDQEDQLTELRHLIVGNDSEQLAELKARVESIDARTRDVAEVLPPAIRHGLETDDSLIKTLSRPVSESLKIAIRKEPMEYAEILYPVMAPSIRRAISQAISSLLVTINRTMESATTVSGLRTRLQSFKTGIPYAELALRRSLVYRVDHIYLIDRDSGLLIDEVASADAQSLDSDAISAMFSAIQSFVQDSFAADESSRLTDLKVGEHNVWVAHGPRAMLACVIYGDAPESLKAQLYDTLDNIRTEYATEMAEFTGDASSFAGVDHHIEPLLQLQLKDEHSAEQKNSTPVWPWLILLLVAGYFAVTYAIQASKLSTVEYYLKKTPGIAITDAYWRNGKIVVEGLKDPDAKVPFATLKAHGVDDKKLELQTIPFRSLENEMELQRFGDELALPSGVQLEIRENKIHLHGEAPVQWLLDNDARIGQLSADKRLDITQISPSLESVSDILRANFEPSDIKKFQMNNLPKDGRTVLQISADVSAQKFSLLANLFARNNWVDVVTERTIEGVR